MKDRKGLSKLMFMLSVAAVILAGIVSITQFTIWIAGTQWILIAIVLAIYAVYLNGCNCDCCSSKKDIA
jgi:hypothetical protein